MRLKAENYSRHNFHNEKLNEWLMKNFMPSTYAYEIGVFGEEHGGSDWGCACEAYWNEEKGQHYVDLEDGTKEEYHYFYDHLTSEYLVEDMEEAFGSLSEEEKEEILDLGNVRVYACPICDVWSVDGDNC